VFGLKKDGEEKIEFKGEKNTRKGDLNCVILF
jgi:hypothetical protein